MNATRYIIFNRNAATADGWIHIVPKGELKNSEAGIVQVLDDQALDAMLANIAADKKRLGENWPGVYAGREHFIYNSEADSEALAWFKEFEKRADGLWASDQGLTDIGREALQNKRYKFTSFAADPADTEKLGGKRARILKIDTIGFTNNPRGKEMLKPITNKNFPGSRESVDGKTKTKNERTLTMKSIATQLKLSAEASEEAILAEVTKLQNRLTTLEPLSAENATLKNRNADLEGEMCDGLLDACGLDTKDAKRPRLRSGMLVLKNRDERIAFLGDFGLKPGAKKKETTTRILNREDGDGGDQDPTAAETNDKEKAQKILNRANELKGQSAGRSFDSCWAQAEREAAQPAK